MRRLVVTAALVAVIAGGCGGGSHGTSGRSISGASSQSTAGSTTATTDGRLGGALIARPGNITVHGGVQKITGRLTKPLSKKQALGAEDNCTDQDVQPTPSNLPHVGDVVFCLMNAMRANAGVPALRLQDQLTKASIAHSQDMVQNQYFAHNSQDGRTVVDRLTDVGYIPKTGSWVIGENLAWGSGTLATPKALVNAWMNSPEHRDNLLSGDFKEVGMGVIYGTPSPDAPDGVTVTTDFGTRPGSTSGTATGSSATGPSTGSTGTSSGSTSGAGSGSVAGSSTRAARHARAVRRARALRRRRALRRCRHRHGRAHTRCVRAARRLR